MDESVQRTLAALEKNNMVPHYVETAAEVVPLVRTLLNRGDTVGAGGSQTLAQTGVMDLLACGDYHYLDRTAPGITREQVEDIYRALFSADCYFSSSNAITEDGALVNMDGNANRIAALAFGPKRVVIVAGTNKLVPDEAAAVARIESTAAPLNARRLHMQTPCAVTGRCMHCQSPDRICCSLLVQRQQRKDGRIHVILVNEALGY